MLRLRYLLGQPSMCGRTRPSSSVGVVYCDAPDLESTITRKSGLVKLFSHVFYFYFRKAIYSS